jgi:anti-sigma factor RsiW
MSHLGDLLSAHVDGELDGAEQDKVSVHLARCQQCRAEAVELRTLKRQIGELAIEVPAEADLAQRVLEIARLAEAAGPTGPVKAKRRAPSRDLGGPARGTSGNTRGNSGPGGPRTSRRPRLTRRRRYLMLGTVSIVMGLGTAAFSIGGGDAAPGPRIIPQVELYSEEHAITTGGVPFDGPGPEMGPMTAASAASPAARQP